jgi:hypothetical protein
MNLFKAPNIFAMIVVFGLLLSRWLEVDIPSRSVRHLDRCTSNPVVTFEKPLQNL